MTLTQYCRRVYGTASALARTLGVSPALLSMWCHGVRRVPVAWCLPIERATRGAVRAGGLRPDVSFRRAPRVQVVPRGRA
jgi:DNA-binding transcriptional regulator YdaS (Cro superfamily)